MKTLQKLIGDKLKEGESLRGISKKSGVEYTSISNYYHQKTEPRGKNLALLADYFNVHFADLSQVQGSPLSGFCKNSAKMACPELSTKKPL